VRAIAVVGGGGKGKLRKHEKPYSPIDGTSGPSCGQLLMKRRRNSPPQPESRVLIQAAWEPHNTKGSYRARRSSTTVRDADLTVSGMFVGKEKKATEKEAPV